MNMTLRNAMRNNRPDNCNTYCTSHSAVRVLNSNMTSRKSPRRNYFYEKHLLLLLATLLLMFVFAWVLSEKTNISQVKSSSVEEPYKYYTSVQVKQGDSLWSIASSYMTAECGEVSAYIDEIKELNHLSNDAIHAGEYLLVPYYEPVY